MKSILYALWFYLLLLVCSALGLFWALLFRLVETLKLSKIAHKLNIIAHYIIFSLPLKLMPIWKLARPKRSTTNPKIIIVSNHLSLLDTPLIASHLIANNYRPIFVGRSGQDKIPLIGWCLKLLGHVFIEFKPGNKAVGNSVCIAMEQLRATVAQSDRVAVIFFCTGLFQAPDDDPLKYELKNGPFDLSKTINIPVLPTWLSGTNLAMSHSDPLRAHPAIMSVQTGEEILCMTIESAKNDCKSQFCRLKVQRNNK